MAGNIKSGVKIFNVTGTVAEGYSYKVYTANEVKSIWTHQMTAGASGVSYDILTIPYIIKGIGIGYTFNAGYNADESLSYLNFAVTYPYSIQTCGSVCPATLSITKSGSSTIVRWDHSFNSTYGWGTCSFVSYYYGYYFGPGQFLWVLY